MYKPEPIKVNLSDFFREQGVMIAQTWKNQRERETIQKGIDKQKATNFLEIVDKYKKGEL